MRDPILFAYQWASLDQLSSGRMLLAACTGLVAGGASAREGAVWGVKDAERAARLTENIDICRRLWSGDGVTFTGSEWTPVEANLPGSDHLSPGIDPSYEWSLDSTWGIDVADVDGNGNLDIVRGLLLFGGHYDFSPTDTNRKNYLEVWIR